MRALAFGAALQRYFLGTSLEAVLALLHLTRSPDRGRHF